jgi:hypothetical protein
MRSHRTLKIHRTDLSDSITAELSGSGRVAGTLATISATTSREQPQQIIAGTAIVTRGRSVCWLLARRVQVAIIGLRRMDVRPGPMHNQRGIHGLAATRS